MLLHVLVKSNFSFGGNFGQLSFGQSSLLRISLLDFPLEHVNDPLGEGMAITFVKPERVSPFFV